MKHRMLCGLTFFIFLLLLSCASQPRDSVLRPPLVIVQPSQADLKAAYGYSFSTNPYLEPVSLLRGKPTEFVVLRLDFDLQTPTQVDLVASIDGATRDKLAKLTDREGLVRFWDMWGSTDSAANRRRTAIERSALPGITFEARKGRYSYYLVLMGKYPINRPGTIRATAYVDGYEPVSFEAPLSEQPSEK